jgi:hypothetical protein
MIAILSLLSGFAMRAVITDTADRAVGLAATRNFAPAGRVGTANAPRMVPQFEVSAAFG